jgi:hypothetical protein
MRLLCVTCLLILLVGCEWRQAETAAQVPPREKQPSQQLRVVSVAVSPADTIDCLRPHRAPEPGPADTLITIGSQHYWLSMRVSTDSTRAIDYDPAVNAGGAFATPGDTAALASQRVRGYEETYTFGLRDSTRRRVLFRRQLHKPDFYPVAARDIVTVMNLARPAYLGYSAALDALVFACYLWVPASDVGERATLLLDRQGHMKRISAGGSIMWDDAIDCDPQLAPAGHAVLTCTELLRAGHPPLQLKKPHALLHVARFLNDSTLLTVYKNGDYQPQKQVVASDNDATVSAPMVSANFVTTPAQRRLPTAYIMRTNGRVIRRFSLTPSGAATNVVPHVWVKPAGTYFLYQENTKLVLVPKAAPERLAELPLKSLAKFKAPLRPHEKRFVITTDFSRLELYVDTLHPQQVRYLLGRPKLE